MHQLMTLIQWPNGSLWDNLISQLLASIFTGVITYLKLKRRHREHTDELLQRLDRIETHIGVPDPTIVQPENIEIVEVAQVCPEPFRLVL